MGKHIRWLAVLVAVCGARAADVNVQPPAKAAVYFRIYKHADLTAEASSPLGGVVYPVLFIKLGPGWRIVSTADLVVKVKDEYPNYVEGTQVEYAWPTISLSDPGWQKRSSDGEWYSGKPTDGGQNQGTEPVWYRYQLEWNSMKHPLGNNGSHTLSLAQPVTLQGPDNATFIGDGAKTVTTENVHVTNVKASNGGIDYFKWDPQSENASLRTPKIRFSIVDADPQNYHWILWFRHCSKAGTWTDGAYSAVEGSVYTAGQGTASVLVDLTSPTLPGHMTADTYVWGTYTYDIGVYKFAGQLPQDGVTGAVDSYVLKGPYTLWIAERKDSDPPDHDHAVWVQGGELRASYYLASQNGEEPAQFAILPLDADLSERSPRADAPNSVNEAHGFADQNNDGIPDGVVVYQFSDGDSGGLWRAVFVAAAADGTRSRFRRTHDQQRMLAANGAGKRPAFVDHGSDFLSRGDGPGYFKQMAARSATAQKKQQIVLDKTGKVVEPTGAANGSSGRAALLSRKTGVYFVAGHAAAAGAQGYCVGKSESGLYSTRATGMPDDGHDDPQGHTVYYLRTSDDAAWPDLSHIDLAWFGACSMMTAQRPQNASLARDVAWECKARRTLCFLSCGLHGSASLRYLDIFWREYCTSYYNKTTKVCTDPGDPNKAAARAVAWVYWEAEQRQAGSGNEAVGQCDGQNQRVCYHNRTIVTPDWWDIVLGNDPWDPTKD